MRSAAQDLANFLRIRHQRNAEWSTAELLGFRKNVIGELGFVEVHDERIELLLLNARHGGFRIGGPIHGDFEAGQNSAQDVSCGVVARNQQCLQIHRSDQSGWYARGNQGQRGAVGRDALEADALPALAPALAAMASVWAVSSTSASTTLSSSSLSASSGATSRSFSAACCSISICLPSAAYLACFWRRTSWISFIRPPSGNLRRAQRM